MKKIKSVKYLTHKQFHESKHWFKCRLVLYNSNDKVCLKCNSKDNIEVDHVKPKSKYNKLAFDVYNLQFLCKACNKEKSNRDETDYRDNDFIQNITEYLNQNNINYKKLTYPYGRNLKLCFEMPIKERKKKPLKKQKRNSSKMNKVQKIKYQRIKRRQVKDKKIDIEKILEIQKGLDD